MADELKQSKEEGLEIGIQASIEISKELGATKEQLISLLSKKHQIALQKATEYVEKYW